MRDRVQHAVVPHIRWKQLLLSIVIWIVSEVGLTWIGLDDLVDCGEYIFKHREVAIEIAPVLQALPATRLVIPKFNSRY